MTNVEKLVALIISQMQTTAGANRPMLLDFGRIADRKLTLITDGIRSDIPRGSYSTLGALHLEPGDRVVVAWIGNEPVILGHLVGT